jgi:hypothetical protein
MVLTNKHVVIAMIVAPILAVMAWFAAGQFTGETPQAAVPGQSYPLVEKSNCRYPSGACDVENEGLRLRLTAGEAGGNELLLTSSHPLDGVVLGVGSADEETEPAAMRAADGQRLEWRLQLGAAPLPVQRIRLVALAAGSSYFADVGTTFLQPQDN